MSDWNSIEAWLGGSGGFISVDFVLLCVVLAFVIKYYKLHQKASIAVLIIALLVFSKPIIALVLSIRLSSERSVDQAFLTDLTASYQVLKHQHLVVLQLLILYTLVEQQIQETNRSLILHPIFYLNKVVNVTPRGIIHLVTLVAEIAIIVSGVLAKQEPSYVARSKELIDPYDTFFTFDSVTEEAIYFLALRSSYIPVFTIFSAIADGCLLLVSFTLAFLSIVNYLRFKSSIVLMTLYTTIPMMITPFFYLIGNFLPQFQILMTFLVCYVNPIRFEIPLQYFMDSLMVGLVVSNYWYFLKHKNLHGEELK